MKRKRHALAGIIGDRQRQVIHAVVDEIMAPGGAEVAFELMPITQQPDSILIHEKISGFGGLTQERQLGSEGKSVASGSSVTKWFEPGAYQEFVMFGERDLLRLRKLGTIGDRGVMGLNQGQLDQLSRDGDKLKKRISNRLQKLVWDALFSWSWTWQGRTFAFDVPGGNALTAATDWLTFSTSTPLQDLYSLQMTHPSLIKYLLKEWIVNPKQWANIMNSQETRNAIKNYNLTQADPNTVAKLLFPGLAPIRKVTDAWQDETVNADGSISLGATTFFVPDNKVLPVIDFATSKAMYPQYGEMQVTENLNDPSATLEAPAQGIYTFVDEEGLKKRARPHVKVYSGFNGAPNLLRTDDLYVISTH